jgi:phosphotriesterase-related protein
MELMMKLHTTLGPRAAEELGMILPHEHLFVEFRTPETPGHAEADPSDVVRLMAPEIERARAVGVTAIVDCTPVGVGRRADILRAVSEATGMPLVAPTGIYREPWVPRWAIDASEGALRDWMLGELQGEIAGSGVRAAWIKLSAGDDGITPTEAKILRAAAHAARAADATVGSHTIRGSVAREQLDQIEACGHSPGRFIWIHASAEAEFGVNLELARRGAWVEYDWIGGQPDELILERVLRMLDAGYGDRLLLSQDRGWYDPALPGGGAPKPYTYLSEQFLPKLRAAGADEATVRMLTVENPFRAYAR